MRLCGAGLMRLSQAARGAEGSIPSTTATGQDRSWPLRGQTSSLGSHHSKTAPTRQLTQTIVPETVNVRPGMLTSSSTTQWATVALDPSSVGRSIPSSFLGISHEWTNVEELDHGGSYLQLLTDLTAYGSGPLVLRVGGGSTDLLADIPSESTWTALQELHNITGDERHMRTQPWAPWLHA